MGWVLVMTCRKTFTVHGLWPSSLDHGFVQMIRNAGKNPDPYCTAPYPLELKDLSGETAERLNAVMPDLKGNNFWGHEWNKHGVCYLKLLNDKVQGTGKKISPTFAKKVLDKYFNSIADLYDRITAKFSLSEGSYENGDALASALGLDPKTIKFNTVKVR